MGSSRCARWELYWLPTSSPSNGRLWWSVPDFLHVINACSACFSVVFSIIPLPIPAGFVLLFLFLLLSSLFIVNSSLSCLGPLLHGIISALSDLMGSRRTGFFSRAREKGSRQDRNGTHGTRVHKSLEDGTKRRYKDAAQHWLAYIFCPYPPFQGVYPLVPSLYPALLVLSLLALSSSTAFVQTTTKIPFRTRMR